MGHQNGTADERPGHKVTVSTFKMDKREVTNREYTACVNRGRCTAPHYTDGTCLISSPPGFKRVVVPQKFRKPSYSVFCVTWQQARQYCRSLGKELPTEAQWEYAALARGNTVYSWGNEKPNGTNSTPKSRQCPYAPGHFEPNAFGLFDMTGNVWEWTNDRYSQDYYTRSPEKDPKGPSVGRYRVIRGGGWYGGASQMRIKNRQWFSPTYGEVSIGFRCVK